MQWQLLAALRFFLALIVAFSHIQDFSSHSKFSSFFQIFSAFEAVLGFLLVSGFSIANSLQKKVNGFYKRRLIRIYPLYAISIFISLVPFLLTNDKIIGVNSTVHILPSFANLFGNLLFLQGVLFTALPSNGNVWSLSVEVFCYLIAPYYFKLNQKKIIVIILGSSLFFFFYSLLENPLGPIPFLKYFLPLILLTWAWLLGFLLFLNPRSLFIMLLVVVLGSFLVFESYYFKSVTRFPIVYCISSIVLILSSKNIKIPVVFKGIFNYLGDISYPLYLFHIPAFSFCYAYLGIKNDLTLLMASLIVSMIFYHFIDVPLRVNKSIKS